MRSVLTALLILFAGSATAQQLLCGPRDHFAQQLADIYGEEQQDSHLRPDGVLAELFASEATGTWTVLLTRPDGVSCVVGSGRGWEPEDKGEPA
jgi:hypothetical protein